MVKRGAKTRVKKIFRFVLIGIITVVSIILVIFTAEKLLPFLVFSGNTKIAKNIIAPVGTKNSLAQIRKKLDDKNISYESIKEASDSANIIVELADGPKVLFSINQDIKWQIESVVLIMQHLTVNDKKPSIIDLTTSRPIVKF